MLYISCVNKTLPASLKDDKARMNERNKHKVKGQMNHQTADSKASSSVFLFFSNAHFLKTILASPQMAHLQNRKSQHINPVLQKSHFSHHSINLN